MVSSDRLERLFPKRKINKCCWMERKPDHSTSPIFSVQVRCRESAPRATFLGASRPLMSVNDKNRARSAISETVEKEIATVGHDNER